MRATPVVCLGFLAALSVAQTGCKNFDKCGDPGAVEACSCASGATGARTCQPEYIWGACDCAASVLPDGGPMTNGGAGGMNGGAGGMDGMVTGGMDGMTTGGMDGMVTGGMDGMTTGGMDGMVTGGMDGMPDDAGADSGPPESPGYVACAVATAEADCGAGAECRESDVPFLGTGPLFVCAPPCATPAECPEPPAGGMATLECASGRCVLTCSNNFLSPIACPSGMTCAAKGTAETCYDDGI